MMKPIFKTIFSALFLIGMITFAYLRTEAPDPNNDTDLDYALLAQHVTKMTTVPHPIGTSENRAVRDYIVNQLQSMGLETEIQKATVVDAYQMRDNGLSMVAQVENIIARLPGALGSSGEQSSDLILMAHYDSRENALGAGDDISGTAAILEVARILAQDPTPAHDVVFLLTDGEEIGLMGAQGFFGQHPAAKRAGLVLNFEARGSSGASSLFETSVNNAWLIENIEKAIPGLAGDSLTYEVYRRMPNDTDMSISKAAGIPGLNFAFAKSLIDYHAITDSSENLSENSLAQQAYYALNAARYFANLKEWQSAETDRTYFDSGFGTLVTYTQTTAIIVGFIVLVAGVGVFVLARRKDMISWRLLGLGGLAWLTVLIFTFAFFQVAISFATSFRADSYPENAGLFYLVSLGEWPLLAYLIFTLGGLLWFGNALHRGLTNRDVFLPVLVLALAVLATGAWITATILLLVTLPCMWLLRRCEGKADIWTASIVFWWLIALLVVLLAPNASYVFVWPLASILVGLSIHMKFQFPVGSAGRFGLVLSAAIVPLLLLALLILSIYVLTGSTAPQGAMVFCVVCLLLIWPLIKQLDAVGEGKVPLILMGAGLISMFMLFTIRTYDDRHPLGEELFFAVDVESGENYWVSSKVQAGTWLGDFFGEELSEFDYSKAIPGYFDTAVSVSAADIPVTPASLQVTKESGNLPREITLQLRSPVGASYINLFFPATAGIESLLANGQPLEVPTSFSETGWWRVRWYGLPQEGAELVLTTESRDPFSVKVVEVKYQLPNGAPVRPADSMPKPYGWSDSTVIYQTIKID